MIDLRNTTTLPVQGDETVALPGRVVKVAVDDRIARLSIRVIGSAGKVSLDQTLSDGDALGVAAFSTLPADKWVEIGVRRDRRTGTAAVQNYFVSSDGTDTRIEAWGEGTP